MCTTCGCGGTGHSVHADAHHHTNPAGHTHGQTDLHARDSRVITLEQDILHKNQLLAERNRGFFEARGIAAFNLVSSPGSGKTSLLERTLADTRDRWPVAVIEGDQQTTRDADRIRATGAPVVQINTGTGCHLDAEMVNAAVRALKPQADSLLFIENVGNLVCPAMFDLGESARVIIISVTEGDDKPLKYPDMFHSAQVCLINKVDLLPYVKFDVDKMIDYAREVSHIERFIRVSATSGEGMQEWYDWLDEQRNRIASGDGQLTASAGVQEA
jgi:hydrogenase nickel incorporation protein HypB